MAAAARACGQSFARMCSAARCTATAEDEHAVSTLSHGPCRPSTNESRPAATESAPPVAAYTLLLAASPSPPLRMRPASTNCKELQSALEMASSTPVAEPASSVRSSLASEKAQSAVSSSSRCCGSVVRASATERPKHE